jgi:hypothetical protein
MANSIIKIGISRENGNPSSQEQGLHILRVLPMEDFPNGGLRLEKTTL